MKRLLPLFILLGIGLAWSCKKDEPGPQKPFSPIDTTPVASVTMKIDGVFWRTQNTAQNPALVEARYIKTAMGNIALDVVMKKPEGADTAVLRFQVIYEGRHLFGTKNNNIYLEQLAGQSNAFYYKTSNKHKIERCAIGLHVIEFDTVNHVFSGDFSGSDFRDKLYLDGLINRIPIKQVKPAALPADDSFELTINGETRKGSIINADSWINFLKRSYYPLPWAHYQYERDGTISLQLILSSITGNDTAYISSYTQRIKPDSLTGEKNYRSIWYNNLQQAPAPENGNATFHISKFDTVSRQISFNFSVVCILRNGQRTQVSGKATDMRLVKGAIDLQ